MINETKCRTGYIKGVVDDLYCVHRFPAEISSYTDARVVLVIPPLMEEMNRSRSLITAICVKLAELGVCTLVVDLYGTGDSCGDLEDANWDIWQSDLDFIVNKLFDQNYSAVSLFAIRAGCLVVDNVISRQSVNRFSSIVYLAPEETGETIVNRWLRGKYLSGQIAGKKYENKDAVWNEINDTGIFHHAGYPIPINLITGFMSSNLAGTARSSRLAHEFHRISNQERSSVQKNVHSQWINHILQFEKFWMLDEYVPEHSLLEGLVQVLGHE